MLFAADLYVRRPVIIHTIQSGELSVFGMTVLQNELFVVGEVEQVDVYDATTLKMTRHLKVQGLERPWDVTSCAQYRRLYVADWSEPFKMHSLNVNGSDVKG